MKKILLVIIFFFSLSSSVLAETSDVKIYVLGERVQFESKPIVVNGNTLVPMRPLFEALGATVTWNESDQLVTGNRGSLSTQVFIDRTTAYTGKNEVTLEEAPRIIDGSTFVPLRFISESFGIDVIWDQANNIINVGKPYEAKDISKIASGAVVFVETLKNNQPLASGSGFIIDNKGIVVTNYHVIDGSTSASIRMIDGRTINVKYVINYDKERDIALLQLDTKDSLPIVNLGDSDKISNGDKIYAIGSPKGLENTITMGLISNKNRLDGKKAFIQLSAAITHGSSGGALLNERAEVIGITSSGLSEADLNFAIPINELKKLTGNKNIYLSDINEKENKLIFTDGTYEGGILNGKREGTGTFKGYDGSLIIAEYHNDLLDGKATFIWSDGSSFIGNFKNNKKEGYGKLDDKKNKFLYEGNFTSDAFQGLGYIKFSEGSKYEGEFYNNFANGKGVWTYPNGETYTGDVKNGAREGYGVYRANNGRTLSGLWANGEFIR